jgi:mannose-6-phosphate isomerase-like protein (cupin superfamily)
MQTIRIEQGQVVKDDGGALGRLLYDQPEASIVHIQVAPGGWIEPHPTEVDMEFFVYQGRGRFSLGNESVEAGPGTLIPSPKNVAHGMTNVGSEVLLVLAIKNPRPECC